MSKYRPLLNEKCRLRIRFHNHGEDILNDLYDAAGREGRILHIERTSRDDMGENVYSEEGRLSLEELEMFINRSWRVDEIDLDKWGKPPGDPNDFVTIGPKVTEERKISGLKSLVKSAEMRHGMIKGVLSIEAHSKMFTSGEDPEVVTEDIGEEVQDIMESSHENIVKDSFSQSYREVKGDYNGNVIRMEYIFSYDPDTRVGFSTLLEMGEEMIRRGIVESKDNIIVTCSAIEE